MSKRKERKFYSLVDVGLNKKGINYNSDECSTIFNRSDSRICEEITVSHRLESFQENDGTLQNPKSVQFKFIIGKDAQESGIIEDFTIVVQGKKERLIIELDEVHPRELFWLGKLFTDVAEYFSVNEDSEIKQNHYECNELRKKHDI